MGSRFGLQGQRDALSSMGLTEATKHVPAGSPKGGQFAKGTAGLRALPLPSIIRLWGRA